MSRYVYDQNPASRHPQITITPDDHYDAARQMQSPTAIILMCLALITFSISFGTLFFEPDGLLVQSSAQIGDTQ